MRILLAGGAGYIGSALAPRLLERGYDVTVADLLWFGNHLPATIPLIEEDIMRLKPAALAGYDQVVFLAGLSNDPMAEYSPAQNFSSNGAAPAYLAYLAKTAGARRFIHAGSCSVYGYTVNELYDEEAPAVSSYPYGISKLQGERGCMQLQDDSFSVISLRKGTVCGYSPRMRLDLVVNTMFRTAMVEKRVVVNNPAIWRPILSIDDAVAAYIRAIESDFTVSGVFNVASGNYTIGEIGDAVREAVAGASNSSVDLEIRHEPDLRNYKVDFGKAVRVLSFKPRHQVDDIVRSLMANVEKFRDFENPNYYNIQVLRSLADHV